MRQKRSRQREWQRRMEKEGRCTCCGVELRPSCHDLKLHCRQCADKINAYRKRRYNETRRAIQYQEQKKMRAAHPPLKRAA